MKKTKNNKLQVGKNYLTNSLIFGKRLIARLFFVLGFVLTMFKTFEYLYDDVKFKSIPDTFVFFSAFIVINYFLLLFVRKVIDVKGEILTEVEFELYEESMLDLSLFTLYWFILSNYHVLL